MTRSATWELAVACAAAVAASAGDLLMLYVGNAQRPELGLPAPPGFALPLGGALGVLGIPLYALGYRALARVIRGGAPRRARVVLASGVGAALVGAAIHGLTERTIRAGLESGAAAAPPMEAVAASGAVLVTLWLVATVAFLAASLALLASGLTRGGALPRSVAWLNPVAVTVVLAAAGMPSELGRSFLVPAAPNLAHVVFFAASHFALARVAR